MPATSHMYVPLYFYCSLYIDPTVLHTHQKQQQITIYIYHTVAIYVPQTIMPVKCHIYSTYAKCFICTYDNHVHIYIYIYVPHMNSLNKKCDLEHWEAYISLLLTYDPEQYACYIAHICSTALLLVYNILLNPVPSTNMPQNGTKKAYAPITQFALMGEVCQCTYHI